MTCSDLMITDPYHLWYNLSTGAEDSAMLESNPSAATGVWTSGRGSVFPPFFICPAGRPESGKLRGVGGRAPIV